MTNVKLWVVKKLLNEYALNISTFHRKLVGKLVAKSGELGLQTKYLL